MSNGNSGGNLRRFYIILAVVAAGGLGAVGYSVGSRSSGKAALEPVDLEGAEDMRTLTDLAVPVEEGDPDAPATLIVFEDYLCTHCSAFSLEVKPRLEKDFVQTGKLRLVFYDYPLNPQLGSFLAARAARCAGDQGRFWEYHTQLMRNQRTWGVEENKIPILEDYAEELGLDRGEFNRCVNSDEHAEEVSANLALARALNLPGTPAVLMGTAGGMSRRLPNYFYETIQSALDSIVGS